MNPIKEEGMRLTGLRQSAISLFIVASLLSVCLTTAIGQHRNLTSEIVVESGELSGDQQHALALLVRVANDLKSESDKPAVAMLQARAADVLWKFNESAARSIFQTAFDLARQPVPENLPGPEKTDYVRRQATAIREVLRRLGAHDRKDAETWLRNLQKERTAETPKQGARSQESMELLAQMATELLQNNPQQAQQLGLLSLSGRDIPENFGRLLFTLSNQSREASDTLFREAIANLRRNNYSYNNALIVLSNYLFDSRGGLRSDATQADAELLINLFIDAAAAHAALWREARNSGEPGVAEPSAKLYSFLASRAMPIVGRYAPDRFTSLQTQMNELLSGLNQQQLRHTTMLTSAQQQQAAVSGRNDHDISTQIERADREKDPQIRDILLRSAALSLMRGDADHALGVAAKISDTDLRAQTEDDVNLVRLQDLLRSRSYDEGRNTILKLNSVILRAKVLAELASHVLSEIKDTGRASEILSEAQLIVQKIEDTPDKLLALLGIAQQFATFDSARGFESLTLAIKTSNQLKSQVPVPPVSLNAPPLTFKSYTVVNGREITTSERATVDSIDFMQVGNLALQDYVQSRAIGDRIENKLIRAKFMIAITSSILTPPRQNSLSAGTSNQPLIRKTSGKQRSPSQ